MSPVNPRHNVRTNQFTLNHECTLLYLVEDANYVDRSIIFNMSWDFHAPRFCQNIYIITSLMKDITSYVPQEILCC